MTILHLELELIFVRGGGIQMELQFFLTQKRNKKKEIQCIFSYYRKCRNVFASFFFSKVNSLHLHWVPIIILDCRSLLTRTWQVNVRCLWREANLCADRLAKQGGSQRDREIFHDTCPTYLLTCLFMDSMGFDTACASRQWRCCFVIYLCFVVCNILVCIW